MTRTTAINRTLELSLETDAGFRLYLVRVGTLLIGIAAAAFIEIRLPGSKGLGLYGIIAINFAAVLALLGHLIMNTAAPSRRGRTVLWLAVALLAVLALAEISEI